MILSFADLNNSFQFNDYLNLIRQEVNSKTGFIRYEDTKLNDLKLDKFSTSWAYPSMSILLRKTEAGAVILNPEIYNGGWQPFDPLTDIPYLHFERYYEKQDGKPTP